MNSRTITFKPLLIIPDINVHAVSHKENEGTHVKVCAQIIWFPIFLCNLILSFYFFRIDNSSLQRQMSHDAYFSFVSLNLPTGLGTPIKFSTNMERKIKGKEERRINMLGVRKATISDFTEGFLVCSLGEVDSSGSHRGLIEA